MAPENNGLKHESLGSVERTTEKKVSRREQRRRDKVSKTTSVGYKKPIKLCKGYRV